MIQRWTVQNRYFKVNFISEEAAQECFEDLKAKGLKTIIKRTDPDGTVYQWEPDMQDYIPEDQEL